MDHQLNFTIDHLFRNEYAKLTSYLTAKFGASNIDLVEDATQDALLKAMRLWSFKDIPEDPGKWLYRVAHNYMIDVLRKKSRMVMYNREIMDDDVKDDFSYNEGIEDDQLKMIFACCHPTMKESDQILLSLKLLCGFSNKEISKALLKEEEAIKKAIHRAKTKFKTHVGNLSIPSTNDLSARLDSVLKVIYLLFNSGYTAHSGENLLKKEVCEDALRLAGILHQYKDTNTADLKALISLMCYQLSRFDARVDTEGKLIVFKHQDRSLWDQEIIELGHQFLMQSTNASNYSNYQLEAVIAREYAISTSFEDVNWVNILNIYNVLESRSNNMVYTLNKLVIIQQIEGTQKALNLLLELDDKKLEKNYLYYSILSNFQKDLGLKAYKENLNKAISLTDNLQEKDFLATRF